MPAWRTISLRKELVDEIEKFINAHPERGYKSISDFVQDAVRRRVEALTVVAPTEKEEP